LCSVKLGARKVGGEKSVVWVVDALYMRTVPTTHQNFFPMTRVERVALKQYFLVPMCCGASIYGN
jgi:hypothetical protein